MLKALCIASLILIQPTLALSQKKAPVFRKIQKKMDQATNEGLVGMTVLVQHPKQGLWQGVSGFADLENSQPVSSNHVFNIASITKTFTAVLVLKLVENGELNLQDKISKYLPDEVIAGISNADQVTVEQLLNMSSGFYSYEWDKDLNADYLEGRLSLDTTSHLEILRKYVYGKTAHFIPGEGFKYSTTNYMLLGMIVNSIRKEETLDQLFSKKIFAPLNLNNTYCGPPNKNTVQYYGDLNKDASLENISQIENDVYSWTQADAGIYSTASDIHSFFSALLAGDLLSSESMELMMQWIPEKPRYGLGLEYEKGFPFGELIGHEGLGFGSKSAAYYFPKKDIYVIILTNTGLRGGDPKFAKAYYKFLSKAGKKLFLF